MSRWSTASAVHLRVLLNSALAAEATGDLTSAAKASPFSAGLVCTPEGVLHPPLLNRQVLSGQSTGLLVSRSIMKLEFEWHAAKAEASLEAHGVSCLLYTSPSPRDRTRSRMP